MFPALKVSVVSFCEDVIMRNDEVMLGLCEKDGLGIC